MAYPERSAGAAVRTLVFRDSVRDWACVAGFVAAAVAVTMVPFVLL
jgi:hypothetical protein